MAADIRWCCAPRIWQINSKMSEDVGRRGFRCLECGGSNVFQRRVQKPNILLNGGRPYQKCYGCRDLFWLDGKGLWPTNPPCPECKIPCRLQLCRGGSGCQSCCAYGTCGYYEPRTVAEAEVWIEEFRRQVQIDLSRLALEEAFLRRCGLREEALEMRRLFERRRTLKREEDEALEMKGFLRRRRGLTMGDANI
ncbi:uncharacterized protein BO97DRAFT_160663 [Aspergillus homomorphus CBS 101889]|uniref:Uncharacterized protein n=1 Tax=Aspergillus homomorphus (strain CBS 101889) TaxID=1450537 RepID=A0A395HTN3_ASPHC|nr:hypothetical protein BO97DRAFT_160663 [Aspergillus homomorphus CBS 101889]RAL09574.1 hypothetical protein BO97DRAFT_160663 [Aspergillus homomorphus CBS 101889]